MERYDTRVVLCYTADGDASAETLLLSVKTPFLQDMLLIEARCPAKRPATGSEYDYD